MDLRIKFNNPDYYKDIRKKVKRPGFAAMDKEKHLAISSKGGKGKKAKDVSDLLQE